VQEAQTLLKLESICLSRDTNLDLGDLANVHSLGMQEILEANTFACDMNNPFARPNTNFLRCQLLLFSRAQELNMTTKPANRGFLGPQSEALSTNERHV
jgi:hypothetical protein